MIPLHDDNPTRLRPVVTVSLIVACVIVFFFEVSSGPVGQNRILFSLGFIPATVFADAQLPPELSLVPPVATVLTSMFLHGGWAHLIGNMLYLWIFGNNVEDAMGHFRFILFYILCGLAAALAQGLMSPTSTIPMVGASGAISGVLGAYFLLYPHARVLVLIPMGFFSRIVYLPALAVLGLWFAFQLLNSAMSDPNRGGVAFMAHVGGFVAGMILVPFFKQRGVRLWQSPRPSTGGRR